MQCLKDMNERIFGDRTASLKIVSLFEILTLIIQGAGVIIILCWKIAISQTSL